MAKLRSTFRCPNCFSQFQKDDSILTLSSAAMVSGGDIGQPAKLDRDIDRINPLTYCKTCRQPLDVHALLQGKLDYHAWGPTWAVLIFLPMFAAFWLRLGHPIWASLGVALLAAMAVGLAGWWLERKRLARWRLGQAELAKLAEP